MLATQENIIHYCAYCGREKGSDGQPIGGTRLVGLALHERNRQTVKAGGSHGICRECLARLGSQADQIDRWNAEIGRLQVEIARLDAAARQEAAR